MNTASEQDRNPCHAGNRGGPVDCEHCVIRQKMLFANLDVEKAAFQLKGVTHAGFQAGDIIYHMGEEPSALYSVGKGIVKLTLVSAEGQPRIVRLIGPGGVVGLEAQLGQAYEHTVECLTEVHACRIPALTLRQLIRDQPVLCKGMLKQWHEHTRMADKHLLDLSSGTVRQRVMQLLALLDELCSRSKFALLLPTNQDCATIIGTRIESVSRVMAELKRNGVLAHRKNGDWQFNTDAEPEPDGE